MPFSLARRRAIGEALTSPGSEAWAAPGAIDAWGVAAVGTSAVEAAPFPGAAAGADVGQASSELRISGHDLRQALEVAIAAKVSAQRGNVPMKLPLQDRSLTLYPTEYRWLGGDATDREPGHLLFSH